MTITVPLSKLKNVRAERWSAERAKKIRQAKSWQDLPPIRIAWHRSNGLQLSDGHHRLAIARERGWSHIKVNFEGLGQAKLRALGMLPAGRRANGLLDLLRRKKAPTKSRAQQMRDAFRSAGVDTEALRSGLRRTKEDSLYRLYRRKNGRRRRRNTEASAAALSEAFHGRPVRQVRDVAEVFFEPDQLADLGRLVELGVLVGEDDVLTLTPRGNVRVAATPSAGQIYFVGGDQALSLEDLKKFGANPRLEKDHLQLGPCQTIAYHTSKAFHRFEPSDYEHEFGEEGGDLPTLCYDVRSRKLYLVGGSYVVKPEGIVN
ncbi:MAG TPA: hypothetical protein DEH78_33330 [Solibacterales bacterium]|nr:hypothetical protein [Bryobacterales bacterium]